MLNPPVNGKIQGLFNAFGCFQVLLKANLIFNDFSRQSCIFKYFSSLCKPWVLITFDKNIYKQPCTASMWGFSSTVWSEPLSTFILSILCMRVAKNLARLGGCTGSSQPWLSHIQSIKTKRLGSFQVNHSHTLYFNSQKFNES